ncbi:MAG: hypothetical protein ACK4K9_05375 [Bacteroidia bacterium]
MDENQLLATEITAKAAQLIKQYNELQNKVLILANENKKIKAELDEAIKKIESLKETNKITKIALGMNLSDLDKAELKQLISEKIKQIDRCLNMLNNLG